MTDRPLPRVVVDTGPTVPGWLLRAASALVTHAPRNSVTATTIRVNTGSPLRITPEW